VQHKNIMPHSVRRAITACSLVALVAGCREDAVPSPQNPQSPALRGDIEGSATAPVSGAPIGDIIVISVGDLSSGGQDLTAVQGTIQYDTTRLQFLGAGLNGDSTRVYTRGPGGRADFIVMHSQGLMGRSLAMMFVVRTANFLEGASLRLDEGVRRIDGATIAGTGTLVGVHVDTTGIVILPPDEDMDGLSGGRTWAQAGAPAQLLRMSSQISLQEQVVSDSLRQFGDANGDGSVDSLDIRQAAWWVLGIDAAPSFESRAGMATNVAPVNLPGYGEPGDTLAPGWEPGCIRRFSVSDVSRIALEVDGDDQPVVGQLVPSSILRPHCTAIAMQPPDSSPSWLADDSSYFTDVPFAKGVVQVMFRTGTSTAQRQAALDLIGGTVIGGINFDPHEGAYIIRIPGSDRESLERALTALESLPQVETASEVTKVSADYREPNDGSGWDAWRKNANNPEYTSLRWGLEAINAPHAWGCEVGSTSTKMALLDRGYPQTPEISASLSFPGSDGWTELANPGHGAVVASIMTASGDNGTPMTGVMWRSSTRAYTNREWGTVLRDFRDAATWGASVVNLSASLPNVASDAVTDSIRKRRTIAQMRNLYRAAVTYLEGRNIRVPLLVVTAGNVDPGTTGTWTTYNNGFPVLSEVSATQVLVVGAMGKDGQPFFSSQRGRHVSIYAPGDGVGGVSATLAPRPLYGTSVAAPFVTGTAGLLSTSTRASAAHVQRALLEGAKRRGVIVDVRPDGAPLYLLDAYEALRVSSEAAHTPLCGNRVYQLVAGAMVVQRGNPATGGYTEEYLPGAPAGSGTVAMWAEHGGRRLFVWDNGIADGVYVLEHNGTNFSLFAGDPWTLSGSDSVFYFNRWRDGVSHSGADVASIRAGGERENTRVRIRTSGVTREIGSIPTSGVGQTQVYTQAFVCPWDGNEFGTRECIGPAQWLDSDTIWVGTFDRHTEPIVEFSAWGDSVFVAVKNVAITRTLASEWTVYEHGSPAPAECLMSGNVWNPPPGHWMDMGAMRCRRPTTSAAHHGSKLWQLPVTGSASTIAQGVTGVNADLGGRQIYWFKLPEGNREILLAVGSPVSDINTMPNNCVMEWRERRTNAKVFELPSLAACQYGMQREGGSALLRAAASGTSGSILVRGRPMDFSRRRTGKGGR
jgi:hypothetical protein